MGLKAEKTDLHQLKVVFQQLDADGDGHISKEEFIAAEKKMKGGIRLGNKWEDVLANCDLDGDGKIDY
jgi:Ca2+-binding EF-hand superfamily protein